MNLQRTLLWMMLFLSFSLAGVFAEGVGDAENGKKVFLKTCSVCHGSVGEGRLGLGRKLKDPAFLATMTDDQLREVITHGKPGTLMGPLSYLGDDKISDVIAFLRTWQED